MSKTVIRGATVLFEDFTFFSANGDATVPDSATLTISYPKGFGRETATVAMDEASGAFSASWESADADPGFVHWHVGTPGFFKASIDGKFKLTANKANL